MKRITVAITITDSYSYRHPAIRRAMINAGVAAATQESMEIATIEAKVGNVRNTK